MRFIEFFAFAIRNPHTRRAYARVGRWSYCGLDLGQAALRMVAAYCYQ